MSGVYTCKVDLSFINDWSIVDHCLYMIWLDCLHVQGWSLIVTINLSCERCWPDHASFMPGTCSWKKGKNDQLPTPCFSFFSCVVWTLPEDQGDIGLPTIDRCSWKIVMIVNGGPADNSMRHRTTWTLLYPVSLLSGFWDDHHGNPN